MLRRVLGALALTALAATGASAQGLTIRTTGDVIIPAGTVQDGSIVTMHGRLEVAGTLRGDALTMNGDVVVSGTVAGSVRTFNGSVLLTSTARVDGDVWTANGRVDRQPGALVGGRIAERWAWGAPRQRLAPRLVVPHPFWDIWVSPPFARTAALWMMGSLLILAAAIAALFPHQISQVAAALSETPGRALLAGCLLWVLLPPVVVALVVSVVGIPLLAFFPLLMTVLALVGLASAALALGGRIAEVLRWRGGPVAEAVIGAAVLAILALAPGVGWLAVFVALTWGVGGIFVLVTRRSHPAPPPPTPSSAA